MDNYMPTHWTTRKILRNTQPNKMSHEDRKGWTNQSPVKKKQLFSSAAHLHLTLCNPMDCSISNQNPPNKQKSRHKWLHLWILPKIFKRINTNPSQTLPKKQKWREYFQILFIEPASPDNKTRQGEYKRTINQYP